MGCGDGFRLPAAWRVPPPDLWHQLVAGAQRDPFNLDYQLGANYCGGHEPVAILAHLICPRPEFLDRGKANLARHTPGYHAIREAVEAVTRDREATPVGDPRRSA